MTDIKYVAFDVHQATISAAVLDLSGKLIAQAVLQTEAAAIRDFLRGLSGNLHLTFEEGTQAQWLFDLTRPLVAEVIVCNPRQQHKKRGDYVRRPRKPCQNNGQSNHRELNSVP